MENIEPAFVFLHSVASKLSKLVQLFDKNNVNHQFWPKKEPDTDIRCGKRGANSLNFLLILVNFSDLLDVPTIFGRFEGSRKSLEGVCFCLMLTDGEKWVIVCLRLTRLFGFSLNLSWTSFVEKSDHQFCKKKKELTEHSNQVRQAGNSFLWFSSWRNSFRLIDVLNFWTVWRI